MGNYFGVWYILVSIVVCILLCLLPLESIQTNIVTSILRTKENVSDVKRKDFTTDKDDEHRYWSRPVTERSRMCRYYVIFETFLVLPIWLKYQLRNSDTIYSLSLIAQKWVAFFIDSIIGHNS